MLARAAGRFQARRLLAVMGGTDWAIGSAFGGAADVEQQRRNVLRLAYPLEA